MFSHGNAYSYSIMSLLLKLCHSDKREKLEAWRNTILEHFSFASSTSDLI